MVQPNGSAVLVVRRAAMIILAASLARLNPLIIYDRQFSSPLSAAQAASHIAECSSFSPAQHFYTLARFVELLAKMERSLPQVVQNSTTASAVEATRTDMLTVIIALRTLGRTTSSKHNDHHWGNEALDGYLHRPSFLLPQRGVLSATEVCQLRYFLVHTITAGSESGVVQVAPPSREDVVMLKVLMGISAGLQSNAAGVGQSHGQTTAKVSALYATTLAAELGDMAVAALHVNNNSKTSGGGGGGGRRRRRHHQQIRIVFPTQNNNLINTTTKVNSNEASVWPSIRLSDGYFTGPPNCPGVYVLNGANSSKRPAIDSNMPKPDFSSAAALRGAIDGFILGKMMRHLTAYYPAVRLSKLISAYYSHGLPMSEISATERIRACDRVRWLPVVLEFNKLQEQIVAYAAKKASVVNTQQLEAMKRNVELARIAHALVDEFRHVWLRKLQNESQCRIMDSVRSPLACTSNADLYVLLDSACPTASIFNKQQRFVQHLLQQMALDDFLHANVENAVADRAATATVLQYTSNGDIQIVVDKRDYVSANSKICRVASLQSKEQKPESDPSRVESTDYGAIMDFLARFVVNDDSGVVYNNKLRIIGQRTGHAMLLNKNTTLPLASESNSAQRRTAVVVHSMCGGGGTPPSVQEVADMVAYFLSMVPPQQRLLYILASPTISMQLLNATSTSNNAQHEIIPITLAVDAAADSVAARLCAVPVELTFTAPIAQEETQIVSLKLHHSTTFVINTDAVMKRFSITEQWPALVLHAVDDYDAEIAVEYCWDECKPIMQSVTWRSAETDVEQTGKFIVPLPQQQQRSLMIKMTGVRSPRYTRILDRPKFNLNPLGNILVHVRLMLTQMPVSSKKVANVLLEAAQTQSRAQVAETPPPLLATTNWEASLNSRQTMPAKIINSAAIIPTPTSPTDFGDATSPYDEPPTATTTTDAVFVITRDPATPDSNVTDNGDFVSFSFGGAMVARANYPAKIEIISNVPNMDGLVVANATRQAASVTGMRLTKQRMPHSSSSSNKQHHRDSSSSDGPINNTRTANRHESLFHFVQHGDNRQQPNEYAQPHLNYSILKNNYSDDNKSTRRQHISINASTTTAPPGRGEKSSARNAIAASTRSPPNIDNAISETTGTMSTFATPPSSPSTSSTTRRLEPTPLTITTTLRSSRRNTNNGAHTQHQTTTAFRPSSTTVIVRPRAMKSSAHRNNNKMHDEAHYAARGNGGRSSVFNNQFRYTVPPLWSLVIAATFLSTLKIIDKAL